jgi:hypothetical protein
MIKIDRVEPQSPAWRGWKARCKAKKKKVIEEYKGGKLPTVTDLYKDRKDDILDMFNGKCAFCEKKITSTQRGDVEHYRPKSTVQEEDWTPARLTRGRRSGDPHPGYWWLAYDSANLLLACILCNQVTAGREFGKGNRFPVEKFRAERPGEEKKEAPQLIDPCRDDPTDYIAFDGTGICFSINNNSRGRTTINMLGLNERGLQAERADRFQATIDRIKMIIIDPPKGAAKKISSLYSNAAEFTAVVRAAFREVVQERGPLFDAIKGGAGDGEG